MPREEMLTKNIDYRDTWKIFVETGKMKSGILRQVIEESWIRSKNKKVDPYCNKSNIRLGEEELQERYEKLSGMIDTVQPFMKTLYKLVGTNELIVRLIDKDGYIISSAGDETMLKRYGYLNTQLGINISEHAIGTNAMGLSLIIGEPIQVFAAEHYCIENHKWASSACPIRNEKKEIIGVLSMTGPYEKVHPHTLGMVAAIVEAIENQFKFENTNRQLMMANEHLYSIMESISEGILSADKEGFIADVNLAARKILKLKEEAILGKNIYSFVSKDQQEKIRKVITKRRGFNEEEIIFKARNQHPIPCISSGRPINNPLNNEVEGIVLSLRESKKVHHLVNKIVGAEARFTFEDILGESIEVKEALKMGHMAATNNTTVLLQGESGTGKELFAQAIHNASGGKNHPFIFLNCGAIPRELVGSELFGYVEGAYTGAKRGGHPGKFELADGGTIFLDEIGDMPLDIQANLLRVLETKQIVRIGGHDVVSVDVRVIAATHKDLVEEVQKGNFRQDLFYRLNVTPIKIPALRERKQDIPLLINHFIENIAPQVNKKVKGVSKAFYKSLMSYSWPGNVRELNNIMQQVINMVEEGDEVGIEHLPISLKPQNGIEEIISTEKYLSLEEIERLAIIHTLHKVEGNMARTAKILGISRSSLYRKVERYNIINVP